MKNTRKNIMKTKEDKNFYLTRAVRRFVKVMHYYNITRVKSEKSYHIDGKFNLDKFKHQMKFLNDWNNKSNEEKNRESKGNRQAYTKYSTVWNYTTGIPYELIKEVLGTYRDSNGIRHKISLDEVISILEKKDIIKVINYGSKFKSDDSGKYRPKCHWHTKYLFKNEKYWYKMMNSNNYDNWWNFIKKNDDKGFHKIWVKWVNKFRNEEPITREDIYKMWRMGGINLKVCVNLDRRLFNTPKEKIEAWLKKVFASKIKYNKDKIDYEDNTDYKDKMKFWNRIVYGNLKNAEFPYAVNEFVNNEFNKVINGTNIK